MRVLNASWLETFLHVRIPYALPFIVSAQEITGSGSIIVAIAAEWMISSTGLGYIINRECVWWDVQVHQSSDCQGQLPV